MALAETSIHRLIEAQLHDEGYPGLAQAVASLPHSINLAAAPTALINPRRRRRAGELKTAQGLHIKMRSIRRAKAGRALSAAAAATCAVGTADGAVQLFDWESLARGSEARCADTPTTHPPSTTSTSTRSARPSFAARLRTRPCIFYDTASNEFLGPSRTCTDTHPARSVAFHPQGDHLLVGTTHAALHLYDMATFRCFLAADASHHHRAAITDARWASDGSLFASCAAAEVKLWQGHNFACCATLSRAHGGTPVGSVNFSKSARYLITSGADSAVKLWDVRMVRDLAAEMGAAGRAAAGADV